MPAPRVPSLNEFPEFKEAEDRRVRLLQEHAQMEKEIFRLRALRPKLTTDESIEAVLEGRSLEVTESVTEWRSRLEHLYERKELLRQAGRVQDGRVRVARTAVAEQVIGNLRSYYADLQQRTAEAVVALGHLVDEQTELLKRLQEESISANGLQLNHIPRMSLADSQSGANAFLNHAEKHHGVKVAR